MNNRWKLVNEIAEKVPSPFSWSFFITDIRDDAVFNIYAPREAWHMLRLVLGLGLNPPNASYDGATGGQAYEEYTCDGFTLSFITPEGSNEHGPDEHPAGRADADARTGSDASAGGA